jgi:hypothetical protein
VSRLTPHRLHRFLLEGTSTPTPTRYAFRRVAELISILRCAGLDTLVDDRVPCVGRYLDDRGYALGRLCLGRVGMGYDRLLMRYRLRSLMGDVFLVAERPARADHPPPKTTEVPATGSRSAR